MHWLNKLYIERSCDMKTSKLILMFLILVSIFGCNSSDNRVEKIPPPPDEMGASVTPIVQSRPPLSKNRPAEKMDTLNFGMDRYIAGMKKAKMIFDPPHEVMVKSTHLMKLVIDLDKSFKELKKEFKESKVLSKKEISVSDLVEVKLTGSAFKVEPITDIEQHLSQLESTIWEWRVTPLKVGEHDLNLVVTAIFVDDKGKKLRRLRAFDEKIVVKSLPLVDQVKNFFAEEYKWLFATFIIPLFLWFIKGRKKEEKEEK